MAIELSNLRIKINKLLDQMMTQDFMTRYIQGKEFHITFTKDKSPELWWEEPKESYDPNRK